MKEWMNKNLKSKVKKKNNRYKKSIFEEMPLKTFAILDLNINTENRRYKNEKNKRKKKIIFPVI